MKLFTAKETQVADRKILDNLLHEEQVVSEALNKKIAQLNKFNELYPQKLQEAKEELQKIELASKKARQEDIKLTEILEERRKEALKPIEKELEEVRALKEQNERLEQSNLAALSEAKKSIAANKKLIAELAAKEKLFAKEKEREEAALEARKEQLALAEVDNAKTLKALAREKQEITVKEQELAKKEKTLRLIETDIKGKIEVSQALIAEEEKAKEAVTKERKMLAFSIAELKKKGLWHRQEMKTK